MGDSPAFRDHFSSLAKGYSAFRPHYPAGLFAWLASLVETTDCAWDCGTGNGQAALGLAGHFHRIVATDASADQIRGVFSHPRITYSVATAEQSGLASHSVDLVTVAQAVHWFHLDRFYREVRRVLKPGGVLALWCYTYPKVTPAIESVMAHLYRDVLGAYWPEGRELVAEEYRTIAFPFRELEAPTFAMQASWTCAQFNGFLRTWSAAKHYADAHQTDAVAMMEPAMERAWGPVGLAREITWRLFFRVGRPE